MGEPKTQEMQAKQGQPEAQVDPELVKLFEALLEKAKEGRIQGVALGYIHDNGVASTAVMLGNGTPLAFLQGVTFQLLHDFSAEVSRQRQVGKQAIIIPGIGDPPGPRH